MSKGVVLPSGTPALRHDAATAETRLSLRAEELARAHHGEMGAAMRKVSGKPVVVGPWVEMPLETQLVCIAAMRSLLEKGVIA